MLKNHFILVVCQMLMKTNDVHEHCQHKYHDKVQFIPNFFPILELKTDDE